MKDKVYSHAWVAGSSQFELARRLGFSFNNIHDGLYCANIDAFYKAYLERKDYKFKAYPRKLIYVGRYVSYKQPLLLAKLFSELHNENLTNGWELEFVGAGPLEKDLKSYESDVIKISGFVKPNELPSKFSNAGAFCLPSKCEHWGVVVHEAVSSGLPLIISQTTFSKSRFLIKGYNGFDFDENNSQQFKSALINLFTLPDKDLIEMAMNSSNLCRLINHSIWSGKFYSFLK